MTPEKIVQNKIISYFKTLEEQGHPTTIHRRQAGGFSYKMGLPDLYAIYNGMHIEIEVKKPGGSLRPMQIKYGEICKHKNILRICASSIEEIEEFMKQHFNI